MSVAKVIEISSTSNESFEDAIRQGVKRASETVSAVRGAWVKDQKVDVKDGAVTSFRVNLMVTFELKK